MAQRADPAVAARLKALQDLTVAELRTEWQALYGVRPPPRVRRPLLELGVAWQLQANAYGGFRPATERRLKRLAAAVAAGEDLPEPPRPRLAPGTRLLRDWHGTTHTVDVTETAYQWQGRTYQSLSAIARAITGARWSGPRFFGLRTGPDGSFTVKSAKQPRSQS